MWYHVGNWLYDDEIVHFLLAVIADFWPPLFTVTMCLGFIVTTVLGFERKPYA